MLYLYIISFYATHLHLKLSQAVLNKVGLSGVLKGYLQLADTLALAHRHMALPDINQDLAVASQLALWDKQPLKSQKLFPI